MDQKDAAPQSLEGPSPHELHQTRLEMVTRRIHEKEDSYKIYNFTQLQSVSLNIFFDLSQEFADIEDVYAVCVMIPKVFFNLECTLHVLDSQQGMVSCGSAYCPKQDHIQFVKTITVENGRLSIPIKGNRALLSQLPFPAEDAIIGMLEIRPADDLTEHDRLFWGRYANRIGYQLHNRVLSAKNEEHVQFIRSLIKDIGHNVIVPNMYFKLFYKRLEARIEMVHRIHDKMKDALDHLLEYNKDTYSQFYRIDNDIEYAYDTIKDQYKEIYSHYQNTSLFLETLLRSSHFEEGRYVLERHTCNFKSQVIDPQVERYRPQFEERHIEIDTFMGGVPDEEVEVVADVGLISQVYANLFSNVVKYAREVEDWFGRRRKFMSYGWEKLRNHFGPGRDGIKLNVFSSGPPMGVEQRERLFSEGYRADNAQGEYGTGHGLYFIREVVGLHGGETGYEPTPQGNNFYFILPLGPDALGRET